MKNVTICLENMPLTLRRKTSGVHKRHFFAQVSRLYKVKQFKKA